jgi:hypothetical protein
LIEHCLTKKEKRKMEERERGRKGRQERGIGEREEGKWMSSSFWNFLLQN